MDSEAVITTATDINGKFSVDSFAVANDLRIMGLKIAKDVSARVLDGRFVGFTTDIPVEGDLPDGLIVADEGEFGVSISADVNKQPFDRTMRLVPMDVVVGIGCKRNTDPEKLRRYILRILEEDGIAPERVRVVSSIDLKKDEAAVLDLATYLKVPARFHSAEELNSLEGDFSQSKFVTSVTTVDCVCERSVVIEGGELTRRKTAEDGMTVAIGRIEMKPRFV